MFTGIVEALGKVVSVEARQGDVRLEIDAGRLDLSAVRPGDSIAVNGVCLTAVALTAHSFSADVSVETIANTTTGAWRPGRPVNLERALTPETRLGGHIVSGHVDGVGQLLSRRPDARSERFRLRVPAPLARYIARKGSVTVDGTSLTVNEVAGAEFDVNIVPHTQEHTVFHSYAPGDQVNIEVDVIARYLERLMLGDRAAEKE